MYGDIRSYGGERASIEGRSMPSNDFGQTTRAAGAQRFKQAGLKLECILYLGNTTGVNQSTNVFKTSMIDTILRKVNFVFNLHIFLNIDAFCHDIKSVPE